GAEMSIVNKKIFLRSILVVFRLSTCEFQTLAHLCRTSRNEIRSWLIPHKTALKPVTTFDARTTELRVRRASPLEDHPLGAVSLQSSIDLRKVTGDVAGYQSDARHRSIDGQGRRVADGRRCESDIHIEDLCQLQATAIVIEGAIGQVEDEVSVPGRDPFAVQSVRDAGQQDGQPARALAGTEKSTLAGEGMTVHPDDANAVDLGLQRPVVRGKLQE